MFNIVQRRYWYFGLSLLVIIPGIIALILWRLPLSIDYTSGTLLEVQFAQHTAALDIAQVRAIYNEHGFPDSTIQTSGTDTVVARSKPLSTDEQAAILQALSAVYGPAKVLSADTVSPTIGAEVAQNAGIAVGIAAIGILIYITIAFRKAEHPVRYGIAAIIAMLHDVLVVLGTAAILGHFLGWEVDALFLTALLTVVAFSVHDTIVVFDRIRERSKALRKEKHSRVMDIAVNETLSRTIITSLTVFLTALALYIWGGEVLHDFSFAMLMGVGFGTYSSVFVASALALDVWIGLDRRKGIQAE
jgi:preprotein translocase subunit SecF